MKTDRRGIALNLGSTTDGAPTGDIFEHNQPTGTDKNYHPVVDGRNDKRETFTFTATQNDVFELSDLDDTLRELSEISREVIMVFPEDQRQNVVEAIAVEQWGDVELTSDGHGNLRLKHNR